MLPMSSFFFLNGDSETGYELTQHMLIVQRVKTQIDRSNYDLDTTWAKRVNAQGRFYGWRKCSNIIPDANSQSPSIIPITKSNEIHFIFTIGLLLITSVESRRKKVVLKGTICLRIYIQLKITSILNQVAVFCYYLRSRFNRLELHWWSLSARTLTRKNLWNHTLSLEYMREHLVKVEAFRQASEGFLKSLRLKLQRMVFFLPI